MICFCTRTSPPAQLQNETKTVKVIALSSSGICKLVTAKHPKPPNNQKIIKLFCARLMFTYDTMQVILLLHRRGGANETLLTHPSIHECIATPSKATTILRSIYISLRSKRSDHFFTSGICLFSYLLAPCSGLEVVVVEELVRMRQLFIIKGYNEKTLNKNTNNTALKCA